MIPAKSLEKYLAEWWEASLKEEPLEESLEEPLEEYIKASHEEF